MVVWQGPADVPSDIGNTVVTIGVFDGMHRGHQAVIAEAAATGRALGIPVVAVTFDPNPLAVIRPDLAPPSLTTLPRRVELLAQGGADYIFVLPFDHERAQQPAEDFVADILVGRLNARSIVVGADFRFGNRAAGDVALLASLGAEHGFDVVAVELEGDGTVPRWSSTYVRERVAVGDVASAAMILGRPFRFEGTVQEGSKRGEQMGYPTANLPVRAGDLVPADGVYAGWVVLIGKTKRMPAAISVGTNPTFDGADRTVEPYVLGRDDLDLYGVPIAVDFVAWLRDQEKFASADELAEQIGVDVERTKAALNL